MTLLKPFQIEDLSRAALHDGCILAWEQGLGKSLAAIAYPLARQSKRTLIVAPGSLHKQLQISAAKFFKKSLRQINTPEEFYQFGLHRPHVGSPKFYVISYTALGLNGGDEWPIGFGRPGAARISKTLKSRRKAQSKAFGLKHDDENVGETQHGITCIWAPTLARVIQAYNSFDCVVVDEGTRLQATESRIGSSVRLLNPASRLVLTGTPVKNRLDSIFWLASWAGGKRWPFKPTEAERERFATTFLQSERFITREENMAAKGRKPYNTTRRSNRLCSVQKLWKTLAPVVIRRRKQDCGEDIVTKIMKPTIVKPGTAQQAVYQYHLNNPPVVGRKSKKAMHRRVQIGVQLTMLRYAALCPDSNTLSESITGVKGPRKSWTSYTPKMEAVLEIIRARLGEGKQVIVGSPFRDFSDRLDSFLKAAGVSSVVLDGDTDPVARGELAQQFKRGDHSVLVAGIKAMGEGHSFENCSDLILPGLTYAYDENEQFIHRVWRLTSKHPVTIYPVIMAGSIDERLHEIFAEKSGSAAMAIDRMLHEPEAEIDFEKLLEETIKTFDPRAITTDEERILNLWDAAGHRKMRVAQGQYDEHRNAGDPKDRDHAIATLKIPSPTQVTVNILRKHYKAGTYKKPTSLTLKNITTKLKKRRP
jgi:SNF2 family DNA or RNA helicase